MLVNDGEWWLVVALVVNVSEKYSKSINKCQLLSCHMEMQPSWSPNCSPSPGLDTPNGSELLQKGNQSVVLNMINDAVQQTPRD